MCSKIGVDPLASSKGFWAQLLGVGDFYYELGVQIVEVSAWSLVVLLFDCAVLEDLLSKFHKISKMEMFLA